MQVSTCQRRGERMNGGKKVACEKCGKFRSNRKTCSWCRKHPNNEPMVYVSNGEGGVTPYSVEEMRKEKPAWFYGWKQAE